MVIGWNESRSVAEVRSLNECAQNVVEAACEPAVFTAGALVHVSCPLTDIPVLADPLFGVTTTAVAFSRMTEMLQWDESSDTTCHKDKVGGGETCVTDYFYKLTWSATPISSTGFHSSGYDNPDVWPVQPQVFSPTALHVGNYTLPPALLAQLVACSSAACVTALPAASLPAPAELPLCAGRGSCPWRAGAFDGRQGYMLPASAQPGPPAAGDMRVSFRYNSVQAASVVATQAGPAALGAATTFAPWAAPSGHQCYLLEPGSLSAAAMFAAAQSRNAAATWALRLLGLAMMGGGLGLLGRPASVAVDLIPFVGPVLGTLLTFGTGAAAAALTVVLGSFTIALCWVAVRPAVGVPLLIFSLAFAAGSGGFAARRHRMRRGSAGAGFSYAPGPSPPPASSPWFSVAPQQQQQTSAGYSQML